MVRWATFIPRIVVVALVGSALDGCILRDPLVLLTNGYHIGAICWSCPCELFYRSTQDPRPASPWTLVSVGGAFVLQNTQTGESREYGTRDELRQAARELGARPFCPGSKLHDVTEFAADNRFAIGLSADGGFLLDMRDDTLETWPTFEEWTAAVRSRTRLDPQRLHDPKSWWRQHRHAGYWTIVGGWFGLGLVWATAPLVRRGGRRAGSRLVVDDP